MKLVGDIKLTALSLYLAYNVQGRPQSQQDMIDALNALGASNLQNADIVNPCDYGWHLRGEDCVPNKCSCDGGVARGDDGNSVCAVDQSDSCSFCHYGHSKSETTDSDGNTVYECAANTCTCENGQGPEVCATNGANVCNSCNEGYHVSQITTTVDGAIVYVTTCAPNECFCHNGYINDDYVCPHHGMNHCSGCKPHHFLQNDGNACIPIVNQNMFYYNVNPSNEDIQQYNHKDEINRYDQNVNNINQNQINQQNDWNEALSHEPTDLPRCNCVNGIPAYGDACPSDGASVCLSCFKGYHADGDDCPINVCTCSTGAPREYPVNGLLCLVDGAEECA